MKIIIGTLSGLALLWSAQAPAGVGLPNPAAKLCGELGGTLEAYVNEDGGALSLCAFKDDIYLNGLIEEWTLFRYKNDSAAPSLAVQAYLNHVPYKAPDQGPVGNPAARYCGQRGGKQQIIKASTGDESGICRFEDGSGIEEWTLFRGPDVHKSLTKVLAG